MDDQSDLTVRTYHAGRTRFACVCGLILIKCSNISHQFAFFINSSLTIVVDEEPNALEIPKNIFCSQTQNPQKFYCKNTHAK